MDIYTATEICPLKAMQAVYIGLFKTVEGMILPGWEKWEKVTVELRIQGSISKVPKAIPSFYGSLDRFIGLRI